MTKIKNNKLLSLIIAFVVSFSFFSVFENVTVNAASSLGSVIDGGKVISAGNCLLSPNGNCKAVMQGDRKSTRLNSSHRHTSRMPSSA